MIKTDHREEIKLRIAGNHTSDLEWSTSRDELRLYVRGAYSKGTCLYLTPAQLRDFANQILEAVDICESRKHAYNGKAPASAPADVWTSTVEFTPFGALCLVLSSALLGFCLAGLGL